MEEDDNISQNSVINRFDAFGDGMEEATQKCLKLFFMFLLLFSIAIAYMFITW